MNCEKRPVGCGLFMLLLNVKIQHIKRDDRKKRFDFMMNPLCSTLVLIEKNFNTFDA